MLIRDAKRRSAGLPCCESEWRRTSNMRRANLTSLIPPNPPKGERKEQGQQRELPVQGRRRESKGIRLREEVEEHAGTRTRHEGSEREGKNANFGRACATLPSAE